MRSVWKGIVTSIFKDVSLHQIKTDKALIVHRGTPINPYFSHSGKSVLVYDGRTFIPLTVKGGGVFEKFGSFIFTKATGVKIHTIKKKNSKK